MLAAPPAAAAQAAVASRFLGDRLLLWLAAALHVRNSKVSLSSYNIHAKYLKACIY
jgi:hypothetical protein